MKDLASVVRGDLWPICCVENRKGNNWSFAGQVQTCVKDISTTVFEIQPLSNVPMPFSNLLLMRHTII